MFKNTHAPRLSEIAPGGRKYQLPTRTGKRNSSEFYMTPELQAEFIRLYPVTTNREMMRLFGISHTLLHKYAQEFGLEKDMQVIRKKQAEMTKRICQENGYYASLRGKCPNEACMEAARRLRANGFDPFAEWRKDTQRYRQAMIAMGEKRKALVRSERARVYNGMEQRTKLNVPYDPYGKKRIMFKHCCKKAGYIVGNAGKSSERWVIYYAPDTKRSALREKHGTAMGFRFEPLKQTEQS